MVIPLDTSHSKGSNFGLSFYSCFRNFILQVTQNMDIQRIMIDGQEIKISAYAEDAKFLIINVHSMELVLAICDTFQEFSSLKLNKEKSEAC